MPYKKAASIGIKQRTKEVLDNYRGYDESWDYFIRKLFVFWKKNKKINLLK